MVTLWLSFFWFVLTVHWLRHCYLIQCLHVSGVKVNEQCDQWLLCMLCCFTVDSFTTQAISCWGTQNKTKQKTLIVVQRFMTHSHKQFSITGTVLSLLTVWLGVITYKHTHMHQHTGFLPEWSCGTRKGFSRDAEIKHYWSSGDKKSKRNENTVK